MEQLFSGTNLFGLRLVVPLRNATKKYCFQVGLEVEVGGVESVLSATVVEIERNQGRIANPGPKVI